MTLNAALRTLLLSAAAVLVPALAGAQGFAAYISPPRFEVQATAGQALRQVLEIQHVGREKGNYRVYTNDWVFNADNSATFSNELAPDSCRPWVAIERKELTLEPGARYRYRFEISPPAGTPARECRFAIMVEGLDPARVEGNLNLPVGGRIAVIVYATIGDAAPRLEIVGTQVLPVNGQLTAQLAVRNSGNATGRIEGFVNGTDAAGQKMEMAPADLPILPGETRGLALSPVVEEGKTAPSVRFPLNVKGSLEWGKNRLPLDARFTAP
jgi:P pilus assembly chaperone PapD